MNQAKADIAAGFPTYKSSREKDWATYGAMLLTAELDARSNVQLYEPMTFNLPGNSYKPDFMHLLEDGRVVFVEIKGSAMQKNYRDSRSKLRLAAATHPWFVWVMATGIGMDWKVEVI